MNRSRSLQFYILTFFVVTSVITFVLLGSYVAYSYHRELKRNLGHSLSVMAEDVKQHRLYTQPPEALHRSFHILESYHQSPFVQLFDHLEFAYYDTPPAPSKTRLDVVAPLPDGRYLQISSALEHVRDKTLELITELLLVFGAVLLLFILIFSLLLNRLFAPLRALVRFCREGSEGATSPREYRGTSDINSLRKAIMQLLEEKQALFKEAAHEIKSPIAILKARLSLYKEDETYPKARFVNEAQQDIATITTKLRELLFLKAVEFDMHRKKECVSMQSQCYLMQQAFGPIFEKKQLQLDADWDGDFLLYTRKEALQRVMQAIFENIFYHTRNGTLIRVTVDSAKRQLRITNSAGGSGETLFSSAIGSKLIDRLSPKLGYTYTTAQEGEQFITVVTFDRTEPCRG